MAKKAVKKKALRQAQGGKKELATGFYAPAGFLRALCYIASLLAPVSGFIFGTIYFSQKDEDSKAFGKICFILMGVGIFFIICWFVIAMIMGVVASGAAASGMNFGESMY